MRSMDSMRPMGNIVTLSSPPLKVGYVLKRFPRLSETFILNEVLELERQGVDVEIFSLLRPPDELRHELLSAVRASITYLPGGSAVGGWHARTWEIGGEIEKHKITDLIASNAQPFGDLMVGKSAAEISQLCLRFVTLAMLASARGIQHLHAHFGSDATTVALMASRLTDIPYSFTAHARDIYHTYIDPKTDELIRRRKIAEAQFVVTVSDYNRRHLIKLAGEQSANKIHRLYNGIDLQRFQISSAVARTSGLLLSIGRLVEKKGFFDLIEACRLLRDAGTQFQLVIVGDGPLRDDLQQRINSYSLERQVELKGPMPQERIIDVMARSSALVLPCIVAKSGDQDGLPTVLLEALASGLPSISTLVAGVPEIIEHRKSGLLVPPEDPARLAEAMTELLNDHGLRQRIAEAGRSRAERLFSLPVNVKTLKGHFETSMQPRTETKAEDARENRIHIV